jgi:hypothetical protein
MYRTHIPHLLKATLILLSVSLLVKCLTNRAEERDCKITDLVLDEYDFPIHYVVNEISSPVAEYPDESAGRMASYKNSLIFHMIARYRSLTVAKRVYKKEFRYAFKKEDDLGKPWEIPADYSYNSPIAQQYHLACGNVLGKYQCRMTGQYEEYFVFFFAYISEYGITFDNLQELLQKIDLHMAECLQTGD